MIVRDSAGRFLRFADQPEVGGRTMPYTDGEVIALYMFWSEEFYAASFLVPDARAVSQFREWLANQAKATPTDKYVQEMLAEYRKQEEKE